jgi:hypothetical protein
MQQPVDQELTTQTADFIPEKARYICTHDVLITAQAQIGVNARRSTYAKRRAVDPGNILKRSRMMRKPSSDLNILINKITIYHASKRSSRRSTINILSSRRVKMRTLITLII